MKLTDILNEASIAKKIKDYFKKAKKADRDEIIKILRNDAFFDSMSDKGIQWDDVMQIPDSELIRIYGPYFNPTGAGTPFSKLWKAKRKLKKGKFK